MEGLYITSCLVDVLGPPPPLPVSPGLLKAESPEAHIQICLVAL